MRSDFETFTQVPLFKEFPWESPDKKFKLRGATRMFIYTFYTNISQLFVLKKQQPWILVITSRRRGYFLAFLDVSHHFWALGKLLIFLFLHNSCSLVRSAAIFINIITKLSTIYYLLLEQTPGALSFYNTFNSIDSTFYIISLYTWWLVRVIKFYKRNYNLWPLDKTETFLLYQKRIIFWTWKDHNWENVSPAFDLVFTITRTKLCFWYNYIHHRDGEGKREILHNCVLTQRSVN